MKKLSVALGAMIVAMQMGGAASSATSADIRAIEGFVAANNAAGLRAYVEANPALLSEDTALSVALVQFMTAAPNAAPLSAYSFNIDTATVAAASTSNTSIY